MKVLATAFDMVSKQIDNVLDPTTAQDAATKNYVDTQDAGDLTRVNDTNVTLTLGGTPLASLWKSVSLTLGWTGTLAVARGGTGTSTSTGTGSVVLSASPTFTGTVIADLFSPNFIIGTNTNDSAGAGQIGQVVNSFVISTAAVAIVLATNKNITSISLTAGDWDVRGTIGIVVTSLAAGALTSMQGQANTTTATITDDGTVAYNAIGNPAAGAQSFVTGVTLPVKRLSLASTTTVFLVARVTGAGTITGYGFIEARRVR